VLRGEVEFMLKAEAAEFVNPHANPLARAGADGTFEAQLL
jgi:hypothetical protein